MKNNYEGFGGFARYIFDYKYNKDNDMISSQMLVDAQNKIDELEQQIETQKQMLEEKDELIRLRQQRVNNLLEIISEQREQNEEFYTITKNLVKNSKKKKKVVDKS